jgi:hypothetical protein
MVILRDGTMNQPAGRAETKVKTERSFNPRFARTEALLRARPFSKAFGSQGNSSEARLQHGGDGDINGIVPAGSRCAVGRTKLFLRRLVVEHLPVRFAGLIEPQTLLHGG